jgi:hypothetical protein
MSSRRARSVCLTVVAVVGFFILPVGQYLKGQGLEFVAWVGIPIAWIAFALFVATNAERWGLANPLNGLLKRLDELLPSSDRVTRAMRWWSLVVLAVAAFTYAHQGKPTLPGTDLPNYKWLWVTAFLAAPFVPLKHVVNNRPPPRDEEIGRIAVKMALADLGKKQWMIAGRPVNPESEEGQEWLYVATVARISDAVIEYNRRWGRDADKKNRH